MKAGIKVESLSQDVIDLISGGGIASIPTAGKKKILNIYWDPDTGEIVVGTE